MFWSSAAQVPGENSNRGQVHYTHNHCVNLQMKRLRQRSWNQPFPCALRSLSFFFFICVTGAVHVGGLRGHITHDAWISWFSIIVCFPVWFPLVFMISPGITSHQFSMCRLHNHPSLLSVLHLYALPSPLLFTPSFTCSSASLEFPSVFLSVFFCSFFSLFMSWFKIISFFFFFNFNLKAPCAVNGYSAI